MSEAVVAKFGGTSMANLEQVVECVAQAVPENSVLVPSAPGLSADHPKKFTDQLIAFAEEPDNPRLHQQILGRIDDLTKPLSFYPRRDIRAEAAAQFADHRNDKTFIVSRGEYYAGKVLARAVGADFIDAAEVMRFGERGLDREQTRAAVLGRLAVRRNHVVVPGFYGRDRQGHVQLFGRGGSDRTGAVLAANLDLPYQNWTDKDGVFSADPKKVPAAERLKEITYREIRELGTGGAAILDRNVLVDLRGSKTVTTIRNTFHPERPGTRLVQDRDPIDRSVLAIASRDDIDMVHVQSIGMNEEEGYAERILQIFREQRVPVEMLPTSADVMSVGFHTAELKEGTTERIVEMIRQDRSLAVDEVESEKFGAVYLVGEELRQNGNRADAIDRVTTRLQTERISIRGEVSNPRSPSIALLVEPEATDDALRAVHSALIG